MSCMCCGSDEAHESGPSAVEVRVVGDLGDLRESHRARIRICLDCGFIAHFVPAEGLSELREARRG